MRQTIVPRLEVGLICLMVLGFLLIAQVWSFRVYQVGLSAVLVATVLNIAVGNLPRQAGPARTLTLTLALLALIAVVFGVGIELVPYLAGLGQ